MSAPQNEWAAVFQGRRDRAASQAAAAEKVDAMLATGSARAGAELEAAIAGGDRDGILSLVYRLRQRPEAVPAEPAAARAGQGTRAGRYQDRREITRAAEAR